MLVGLWAAQAQLPPSGVLSESEQVTFHAEIARVGKLLDSPTDKATVTYVMARTFAAGEQWPEAIHWLRKAVGMRVGLDPSRDRIFAKIRSTTEFVELMDMVREATPAVLRSKTAFQVEEGDLQPESVAYDPVGKQFYFGSTSKGKVLRCSRSGDCQQFTRGVGRVLGLKVRGNALWLLNNSDRESALIGFDLASGRMVGRFAVEGAGHEFNDLAFGPAGDVYLTDTRAGGVWHLEKGADELRQIPGKFELANGITVSSDGRLLYVSSFPDGIQVVDLKTHAITPVGHDRDLCLVSIDGLYFHRGVLVAIQNSVMMPRVVRMVLSRDLRTIERFEVLERRNPWFDGVTTGVMVGDEFFYMANVQDDKKEGFNPIRMLMVQIFGVKSSQATRAAERFFKERGVALQIVDLKQKPMARGEIKRFIDRFSLPALIDSEGKAYADLGLKYLKVSESELLQKIELNPGLLKLPLVRAGNLLSVSLDEAGWKAMSNSVRAKS
jgi:arsenate reductase